MRVRAVAGESGTLSVGSLVSASSTAVIQAGVNNSNGVTGALALNNASGTSTYAGILRNGSGSGDVLSVTKAGAGTQVLTGTSNTYSGGTTISAGTLLVNNASGSGTGVGAVTVNGTGTLGGTGFIKPTGANGISVANGAFIAPGASIGTLTLDLGSTTGTVDLTGGGDFKFELGTANASIGSIAAGSSDLLTIAGASASDVAFGGGNNIDLLASATGAGFYKLFDTSAGATTWTGLTLGSATTGGNLIAGGLTTSNFGGIFSGSLILADGSAGTSSGDIYLQVVVPEPGTFGLIGTAVLGLMVARRRRSA